MTTEPENPKTIYQRYLDIVTKALMDKDFETVLDHLEVPAFICSHDQQTFVESREHMLRILKSSRKWLDDMKVDTYVRVCREAEYVGDDHDCIVGEHETFAMRQGLPIIPAYRSTMAFIPRDDRWLASGITANVSDRDFPITRDDVAIFDKAAAKQC